MGLLDKLVKEVLGDEAAVEGLLQVVQVGLVNCRRPNSYRVTDYATLVFADKVMLVSPISDDRREQSVPSVLRL